MKKNKFSIYVYAMMSSFLLNVCPSHFHFLFSCVIRAYLLTYILTYLQQVVESLFSQRSLVALRHEHSILSKNLNLVLYLGYFHAKKLKGVYFNFFFI